MRTFHITPLTDVQGENIRHQDEWSRRIHHKIDNLNKPKGSLGMLEISNLQDTAYFVTQTDSSVPPIAGSRSRHRAGRCKCFSESCNLAADD